MPNLNKVMLMGNLTRDPEMRFLPSNMPVVNIGLAVNRRWRNKEGEPQEETTFVDCEAFGRTAEVINQYLKKGRPLYVEGRLKLDQWQDKEGNNRSKMKVVVESFEFIDSRGDGGGGGGGGDQGGGYQQNRGGGGGSAPRQQAPPQQGQGGSPHQPVEPDDIPF
ncbi:MAG: single-stranded DNA-binding protein [Phycisphaeraceae bacterium]